MSQSLHKMPHQLCELCRDLAQFYSRDIFWNEMSYINRNKEVDQLDTRDQLFNKIDLESIGAFNAHPIAHHSSLDDMDTSAAQECRICSLFRHASFHQLSDDLCDKLHQTEGLYVRPKFRVERHCRLIGLHLFAKPRTKDRTISWLALFTCIIIPSMLRVYIAKIFKQSSVRNCTDRNTNGALLQIATKAMP